MLCYEVVLTCPLVAHSSFGQQKYKELLKKVKRKGSTDSFFQFFCTFAQNLAAWQQ
jgi:hypothetical protein